jgi:subtilisin family serine protease
MNYQMIRNAREKFLWLFLFILLYPACLLAQNHTQSESEVDEIYINWYNKDDSATDIPGISAERAYDELLKNRKSKTVIVAVIDGGVDTAHEDLKGKIWTNEKEIPGNGIDDDHNGFIDDIHGWNFLGNAKGENIEHETLELTRLYKKYADHFGDKTKKQIPAAELDDYKQYEEISRAYLKELIKVKGDQQTYTRFLEVYKNADSTIKKYLKKEEYTTSELKAVKSYNTEVNDAASMLIVLKENDLTQKKLEKLKKSKDDKLEYNLNPDYDIRQEIIGDNPERLNDMPYGNNDVCGPDPSHGTFVSGIITANRNNSVGVNGIADNVLIMSVRAVPNGDERDKDVANAIRYAVDNGAQVINMSFGKDYSPQKIWVDEAILYAESRGVLLVHAAGNDSKDLDEEPDFPSPLLISGRTATNMLTVGASSIHKNENFVSYFSNYGRKMVDLFAPGENIYGLKPHNKYELGDGTSFAAPMVAGTAALLKSYYPELTADLLKTIILQSATQYHKLRVRKPSQEGKSGKKKFYKLSASGAELNAYNAIKMAEQQKAAFLK